MARRVGICAVAQTTYQRDKWHERFQGMALEVLEPLLEKTGLDFSEEQGIGMSISVSDDVFDARFQRLIHNILDGWPVDDRKHLFRNRFCCGQNTCAKSGDRQNGLSNAHQNSNSRVSGENYRV